ncbi:hypothetical protein [Mesorhizobium sp. ZC-5]|uniref:hypothetical protein n=1 Tax=Mesorhizobium sp. ZC-5 TaxID=2986066 RepID=UPI0021E8A956|nr:hypothetical protein [Mesorhizobium sp. ZC-5]MCV3243106.1 hypothetical protein [Mesorhizobium sp. ZC-5]
MLGAMGWLNHRWMERPVDVSAVISEAGSPALQPDSSLFNGSDNLPQLQATETLLRPLFHANRRPFVAPPPEVTAAPVVGDEVALLAGAESEPPTQPEPKPNLMLVGISISGGTKSALLGLVENPDVRWYSEGDNLDGWILASINNQAVTMARDEETFMVTLYPISGGPGDGQ